MQLSGSGQHGHRPATTTPRSPRNIPNTMADHTRTTGGQPGLRRLRRIFLRPCSEWNNLTIKRGSKNVNPQLTAHANRKTMTPFRLEVHSAPADLSTVTISPPSFGSE
jgi:hypothetical protein